MKVILILAGGLFMLSSGLAQNSTPVDLHSIFEKYDVQGCFVLFDETGNEYQRYNPARCDSGYIPASTFKIPHSVIALEEGIVKDTGEVIHWDGHQWPNINWNRNQTLKTAIKFSCVWVYTGFAKKIGIDKYYHYVNAFNYGNKNLAGPPDRFWLAGQFRISANQQIDFLRKFYHNQLPVSKQSIDRVKDIIVLEQTDAYKLSGKTGGGVLSDTAYIMWLVGYLEKGGKTYFYAMNFTSGDFEKTSQARYTITKDILHALQLD